MITDLAAVLLAGGAASGRKGSIYERELVNALRGAGYGALRLPSSGSATEVELPDILAAKPVSEVELVNAGPAEIVGTLTDLWAIEAKSGKEPTLYVDGEEVDQLRAFCERWGAKPLLGHRSTRRATSTAHYLVAPEAARGPTEGGSYGLPVADIEKRAYAAVWPSESNPSVEVFERDAN